MQIKIGKLAKMTGCQVVTIRYYEKKGLLRSPERTESNYRLYGEEDVARLRFIRHCRQHGMSLAEIHDLLSFSDNPTVSCDWINTLIEEHIAKLDEQIRDLTQLRGHLQKLLRKCAGGKKGECGILKSLNEGESCAYCQARRCQEAR
jgi:Cd(II)/Pb(II)-responsive transcriptional regulator